MIPKCAFLSPDPMINDVYKFPETRYVCRCVERVKNKEPYSARFVGNGPEDCDACPFYKNPEESENGTDDNK